MKSVELMMCVPDFLTRGLVGEDLWMF